MKTAVVFSEGTKQIILTPENDEERFALKLITPNDNITLAIKSGSFCSEKNAPFHIKINESKGGYLRAYQDEESIMLVLIPKTAEAP